MAEYIALASSEDEASKVSCPSDGRAHAYSNVTNSSGPYNALLVCACIAALLSSVLSVLLFARDMSLDLLITPTRSPNGRSLRRPSQYMNLDRVLENSTYDFPPITNFPPVTFQVKVNDPLRTMWEDERGWYSKHGTVYPDDRRIVVNAETSTVLQFRNMDYAMERCILNITIPQRTDTFDPNVTVLERSSVDIWVLDAGTELLRYIDGATEYAPKRRELLTTLSFSALSSSSSGQFHCPSVHFTTLELSCSPSMPNCNVDFWQDQRARPIGGLHMIQYSSIRSGR
ncbi:unnamed protein product [Somion occarium]|uniref:Ubiquitin 3 binding protein But2 C-terminal domain-containing protein n=1 Tax=Somion occarium TaxID=3059160 RepID=A0ABP1CRA7_9APHY